MRKMCKKQKNTFVSNFIFTLPLSVPTPRFVKFQKYIPVPTYFGLSRHAFGGGRGEKEGDFAIV